MSQMESVEQVNVGNNTGAFEQVSQQVWNSIQNEPENSLNSKVPVSESRANSSADSHLPSVTFSGQESEMLQKQDAGAVEGEAKDMLKKHRDEEKPFSENKPKPPMKPTDKDPLAKPSKPRPDNLKPAEKPKPAAILEPVGKFEN